MYNGSEHITSDSYMVPGISSGQQIVFTPSFPEIGSMGNDVPPEFIVDQGLYYSAAAPNYYSYYCTGYEAPGESDDCHRFFGLDGQDLLTSEMQAESLPIVYYTPNYGFAHSPYSPYNPYNPYIPGAVIGVDSQYTGTQQYLMNVAYQQQASSPTIFPFVVQSGADIIPSVVSEPLVFDSVGPGAVGVDPSGRRFTPLTSAASTILQPDIVDVRPVFSRSTVQGRLSETPKVSEVAVVHAESPVNGATAPGGGPHVVIQARDPTSLVQASDLRKVENVPHVPSSSKCPVPMVNGSTDFEPSIHGRTTTGVIPAFASSGNRSLSMMGEQNRGPRIGVSMGPCKSLVVKGYTTKAGACNSQGAITVNPNQYNKEDFPVNYSVAKFFVIKSYSEDDVHKSIKYNVWSSTPSGNKRLDSAYEEAQRISGGDSKKCPVFLFFSVNTSGQFCGMAEMTGPVDFNRDMDFWQQDKWTGSFPVKWHIIKDIPNTSLRHIILENNENKPVTNSRDTQEIKFMPGMSMLAIFKNSPLKTSLLDDFMFYEERERVVYEDKHRLFGRTYGHAFLLPSPAPPSRCPVTIKHPPSSDGKQVAQHVSNSDATVSGGNGGISAKPEHAAEANNGPLPSKDGGEDAGAAAAAAAAAKVDSLSLEPVKAVNARSSAGYVTVGSLPVKVNGYADSSSGASTDGTVAPKSSR